MKGLKIEITKGDVKTQLTSVMYHLQEIGSITSLDAIKEYGATRLSHLIYLLRKKGYMIDSVNVTTTNRWGNKVTYSKYYYVDPDKGRIDKTEADSSIGTTPTPPSTPPPADIPPTPEAVKEEPVLEAVKEEEPEKDSRVVKSLDYSELSIGDSVVMNSKDGHKEAILLKKGWFAVAYRMVESGEEKACTPSIFRRDYFGVLVSPQN
jgi:hypothetical protein